MDYAMSVIIGRALPDVRDGLKPVHRRVLFRITSYNVCYTKLLRAMYLSRQLTSSSYPEIGERFGGKDHSTIIHAIRKIEKLIEEDFQLRSTVDSLKKELTN